METNCYVVIFVTIKNLVGTLRYFSIRFRDTLLYIKARKID